MTAVDKREVALLRRKRAEAERWLALGQHELVEALAFNDNERCEQLWSLINLSNEMIEDYDRGIALASA